MSAPAPAAAVSDDLSATQLALNEAEAKVVKQGMLVREMKKEGKPVEKEVALLNEYKKIRDDLLKETTKSTPKFDVEGLQNLLLRRMVVVNAFEIHGGVAGLLDLGPPGVGIKDNIVDIWKKHFIIHDSMLQVETTNLTPHSVLNASGHVQRFNDLLVEEVNPDGSLTGVFHRADKILEAHIEAVLEKGVASPAEADKLRKLANGADSLGPELMDQTLKELNVRGDAPKFLALSPCRQFNLMFGTTIGPSGQAKAFLRPETAQGIFVNFKKLLEFNNGKMPFASAQVGTGFRNEIAPRGGLVRVREFTMAEIEHFVHPEKKQHERFSEVADVVLQLFTAKAQTTTFQMERVTARDAVAKGMINNETLAYFMARSHLFFIKVGIDPKRLRFRQHLPTEMAHYASDCYDAEILLSTGWLECAGHADRACFDLTAHMSATGQDLTASEKLPEPRTVNVVEFVLNRKLMGPQFRATAMAAYAKLEKMSSAEIEALDARLSAGEKIPDFVPGAPVALSREHVTLSRTTKKEYEERYSPSVIEPSFGIGRVVHAVLEHAYWVRAEKAAAEPAEEARDLSILVRNVLSLTPVVAPFKCGILPQGGSFDVDACRKLVQALQLRGMNAVTDFSGASIGKRYARFDEIGVPFVATVDDQTVQDGTITIRERDTEEQIRVPNAAAVVDVIAALCVPVAGQVATWAEVSKNYPIVRAAVSKRPEW